MNGFPEEIEDDFYAKLQNVIDEVPERNMKILVGDMNAIQGRNNEGIEDVMVREGLGENVNENGAHFICFCVLQIT